MSKTQYIVVPSSISGDYNGNEQSREVAALLDEGWTLIISWVAESNVHHILSKENV